MDSSSSKLKKIYIRLKSIFDEEDFKFKLKVALKVTSIPVMACLFLVYMIWVLVTLDNIYFESNGFLGIEELRDAFSDYIILELSNIYPYIAVTIVALFFSGIYLGSLLLRPFKIIGEYCVKVIDEPTAIYEQDMFADYKVLNEFSEYFFAYVSQARKNKKFVPTEIPSNFLGIHKPVFDKVFFFHFSLYLLIINIICSIFLTILAFDVHESIVKLAISTLKLKGQLSGHFLLEQTAIVNSVIWVVVAIISFGYVLLAFHLYARVSGPSFGFFATMRSFLKGNVHTRVHLLDFNHIRPYSRAFNKYLDYIQRNIPLESSSTNKESKKT